MDKQYSSTEIEITLIMITVETSMTAKQPHQEEHHKHHQQHPSSTERSFKG